jgi:hypothetical protein
MLASSFAASAELNASHRIWVQNTNADRNER